MGKSNPSPPAIPDYTGAAQAQGAANLTAGQQSASLSNPNINSPYGNQTVTWDTTTNPDMPQATINQTLTPAAQSALDAQQQTQLGLSNLAQQGIGQAQGILGSPFNYNGPGVQTGLDTSGVANMPVNAGMTGQNAIMSRLQPQMQQSDQALTQRLANQGITPGSEAYNNAMRTQQQGNNDMLQQAALNGISLDTQANNQGFNQALQSGQFGNTAQQQSLAQQLQLYNQPLNAITALMSGGQIQNPQFQGYTGANVAATPVFQGVQQQGQAAMDQYGIQQQGVNAQNQAIGGLLGGAASFIPGFGKSDIRLKSNIVKIGDHPLGIGIYEYDLDGVRQRGVMAQEVLLVKPEAVAQHPSGYLMVNYGAL